MLILAIGDLHIPDRENEVPAKFLKLLSPGKIGQVLCLGNATDLKTTSWLQSLAPDYQAVKGEFDLSPALPLNKVISQGKLKIGLISGHTIIPNSDPDSLLIAARQLDVDIIVWGGSHKLEAYQMEGKFFINPGSATGAFYPSSLNEKIIPSFCLLDVQGAVCVLYIYSYVDGQVKIEKVTYRKNID